MQILLLSFHLGPESVFVSNRTVKLARFLIARGHDLRILTATDPASVPSLKDFDQNRIVQVPWHEAGGLGSQILSPFMSANSRHADSFYGWGKAAIAAAKDMFQTWKPDVLYATCPPHSTSLIAAQLSHMTDIPFVAEFRERWAYGDDDVQTPRQRQWDKQKERDVLSRASAIVTASPIWADSYARLYGAEKVTVALDGFDPSEYPLVPPAKPSTDREKLNVLYSSAIEPGRSDPRHLLKCIAALGDGAKDIRLTVIGDDGEEVLAMAKEERVHKQLDILPAETREEIIDRQYSTDVIALSLSTAPRDTDLVASEIFDCIGARRPVIATGLGSSLTAEVIRKRELGVVSNEPKVIASGLARLLAKKRAVGVVPFLPDSVRSNASSSTQFTALEPMLFDVVGSPAIQVAAE